MSKPVEIKLWCWVLGDTSDQVFSVSLQLSATIEDLKVAIQTRKPSFKHISVDSLKVSASVYILTPGGSNCLLRTSTKIVLKALGLKKVTG